VWARLCHGGTSHGYRWPVRLLLFGVLLACLLSAAACGGSGGESLPPPLPGGALPGLTARERDLPLDELAADAYEPEELHALLDGAGYTGGRERELTGHTDTFDHVLARTLRFDVPDGAGAYLDWVAAHTVELVGRTRSQPPLRLGNESLLFELEPCGTCKKQLPTLVAVWRRGGAVGYVLASGRQVDRVTVGRVARLVDRSLS
jgi:hypothetical protein